MIYNFLKNVSPNHNGLFIEDVLKFDFEKIENEHDYIQLLFPLKERSKFHPTMPVLTDLEIELIKNDETVLENIKRSVEMMMKFYENTDHWLRENGHNLLRITRILKSTRIFFGEEFSKNLHEWFLELCDDCDFRPEVSKKFWQEATEGH